jgi:protein-disulfide isomerase
MQLVSGTTPGDKRKALHDWYEWMDFEKFKEKYPLKVVLNVKELLTQHEQWMADAKIEYTPTIFINGYQLPKHYIIKDLKNLLKKIEKFTQTNDEVKGRNNLVLI